MTELASHGTAVLKYDIAISREQGGSWIATIEKLEVRESAATAVEARSKAQALALRTIADLIENDGSAPDGISFAVWLE